MRRERRRSVRRTVGLALASAEASVHQVEGGRRLLETWIDWCIIRSPVNGVVLDKPVAVENETPIVFIPVGRADAVYALAEAARDDGFHVNVSGFPAVPSGKKGLSRAGKR